jgi:cytochrome c oxidase subunit 2
MLSDLPVNASSFGDEIDGVLAFVFYTTVAWFAVAELVLLWLVLRYRKRDGVRAAWMPATTLKAQAWVLAPAALILVFDFAIEAKSHHAWNLVKLQVPPHDLLVRITGRQFAWTFTYAGRDGVLDTPDDFETVNQLRVPRGAVVRFQLESHDVLHSFWVPALRLKQDAVPGRSFPGWFEATREGSYDIACAELCGAAHTSMRARLEVDSQSVHAAWASALAEQQQLLVN